MPKKSERTKAKERLDKACGDYIKKRDGYRCVQCGNTQNPTWGHLFSRVNFSTRWDEENCYCQCSGCNLRHEYEFEPFRRVVEALLGREKYDALYQRHVQVRKFKIYQLDELTEYFRRKLDELSTRL